MKTLINELRNGSPLRVALRAFWRREGRVARTAFNACMLVLLLYIGVELLQQHHREAVERVHTTRLLCELPAEIDRLDIEHHSPPAGVPFVHIYERCEGALREAERGAR